MKPLKTSGAFEIPEVFRNSGESEFQDNEMKVI